MDKQLMIKKYSEALEEGRAAVFAGAGLSVGAGFVDWAGLLADVAAALNVKIEPTTNLVELAQYYVNDTHSTTALSQAILDAFPSSTMPTENHRILSSLPIKTYWTTNFDKLIERALEAASKSYDVKALPERLAISKSNCDVVVYKMHGDIDNPDKTILTRDHFERYPETHQPFLNNFEYDLANKTFLFLGLSFDDPNLREVLKYARKLYHDNQRIHYYILKRATKQTTETDAQFENRKRNQELFVEDMKNYGIQTVMIDDYAEITEILYAVKNRYLRRTVFVSGAAVEYGAYGEDAVKNFVRNLSKDIIKSGFRIVNGYGLGFGNEVLAGAMEELNDEHRPVDGNLIMKPFPQGIPDPRVLWTKYRTEMISSTGITLFFLGNKKDKATGNTILSNGMREEFEISKKHGNLLVPIGATGFVSKELWEEVYNEIKAGGSFEGYLPFVDVFKDLGDSTLSLDKLHHAVMWLLKEVNK